MLTKFIRKRAGHYNLGEMSILFALFSATACVVLSVIGVNIHESLELPAAVVVPVGLSLWTGFVVWLWVSIVLVGRESAPQRVSTRDLNALLVLSVVNLAEQAISATADEPLSWEGHAGVYAWVLVALHIIYFTFAWALRVRVPFHTYLVAALVMGLAWWRFS